MTIKTKKAPLVLTAAVLITLAGCGSDFAPPSYLDGLRVLALIADPLEAGPADQVTITPVVYLAEGESLESESWSFCPFSLGPAAGYECAVPACETGLTPDADGTVSVVPGQLALQCANELAAGDLPEGIPSEIPEKVDVYFNYLAASTSGETREAVLRLALWTMGPPAELNQSPAFAAVTVAGNRVQPGDILDPVNEDQQAEIRVQIDPASLDKFTDQAGDQRREEAILSFYATAGRFEFDRVVGEDISVSWKAEKLEPGQSQADLYIVARDLRGGQAVFGPVTLPINLSANR